MWRGEDWISVGEAHQGCAESFGLGWGVLGVAVMCRAILFASQNLVKAFQMRS